MPAEWRAICKDCGKPFTYSDFVHQSRVRRGLSAPERCVDHRARHSRETSAMASSHFGLQPAREPSLLGTSFLGSFDRSDRGRPDLTERQADPSGMDLGLNDNHVAEIYQALEDNRVLVVVAPTGAGKSTVIPHRLLSPLPSSGLAEDHFTRNGRKIIVTQPRRDATSDIPRTIARKMHGSTIGPGSEIGYRHSQDRGQTDPWNRLIFLTDGTLVNWLIEQRTGEFSIIIVDEAHERSATIDLILGLLRSELLKHPHLRVIILSATIHADTFVQFFSAALPGKVWFRDFAECQKSHSYEVRWPAGDRDTPPEAMVGAVADKILELLRTTSDGGILAFLPGEGEIEAAIRIVEGRLSGALRAQTLVLPLYGALPKKERERANGEVKKSDYRNGVAPRRVVVATNIAETSCTFPDVAHVVDSGLLKESTWDPVTRTDSLPLQWSSQAGCRQRWGRAGRNRPGTVYPIYSRKQYEAFEPYAVAAVSRECLDDVLIKAKRAGVSDLRDFAWLEPPPEDELNRVQSLAADRRYVDSDGDLTERGSEIFELYQRIGRLVGEGPGAAARGLDMAALLMMADRYGCLIEAASFLAIRSRIGEQLYWLDDGLFYFDRDWPLAQIDHVQRLHQSLGAGCRDDLDFGLKIFARCEGPLLVEETLSGPAWARQMSLNLDAVDAAFRERDEIIRAFSRDADERGVRRLDPALFDRLRFVIGATWPDYTAAFDGDGWWRRLDGSEEGPVSIHSRIGEYRGEAAITAFGRRARGEDGIYETEPIASIVVRSDRDNASLDAVGLARGIHALREAADHAIDRLTADLARPVGTVQQGEGTAARILSWSNGEDGIAVARLEPERPPLRNDDVLLGEEIDVRLLRDIAYLPTGRVLGVAAVAKDAEAWIDANDLSFSGRLAPEGSAERLLRLVVVGRDRDGPKLSLLPRIEAGWSELARSKAASGTVVRLRQSATGETYVEIAVELPGIPGETQTVVSAMPRRNAHLQSLSAGDRVHFKLRPAQEREWSFDLRDTADDDEEDAGARRASLQKLKKFNLMLRDGKLMTATRLSVEQLYAAIGEMPIHERAIRFLFRDSHELWAAPDSLETEASFARGRHLRSLAKALWERAWVENRKTVIDDLTPLQKQVNEAQIGWDAMFRLRGVFNDIYEIAELRSASEAAAKKRGWAVKQRQFFDGRIAGLIRNIEKNRGEVLTTRSAVFIERAAGWIEKDSADLARMQRERIMQEPEWHRALADAERLDMKARTAVRRLDELRQRDWS